MQTWIGSVLKKTGNVVSKKREKDRPKSKSKENWKIKKTYSAYTATMTITFRALNKKGVQKKTGGDADQFSAFGNGQKIAKIDDMGNGMYSWK